MTTRAQVRRRRRIQLALSHLSGASVPALTAVALAGAAVALVVTSASSDWTSTVRGFASNIVTAALLALFAYLVFVLRFRVTKLRQYRRRSRRDGEQLEPGFLETVARELLSANPPRACLLVGVADIARRQALEELAARLARARRTPIRLDLAQSGAVTSIPLAARERFVAELAGTAGDTASGGRIFARELASGRAVAVIDGLGGLAAGMSRHARRERIASLLQGSLDEGLPFVAALPEYLEVSLGDVAVVRIPTVGRKEVAEHLRARLRARGQTFDAPFESLFSQLGEQTRDPDLLELAGNLMIARVRRGDDPEAAARDLFAEPSPFLRHLGWMNEWALGGRLAEASAADSAAALALRTIGVEAHYRRDQPTTWDDAVAGLDHAGAQRFAAGVAVLLRRGVLTAVGDGRRELRFTTSDWLAFAGGLGLGLDPRRWADLLRVDPAQPTLHAFSAALLLDPDAPCRRERSYLAILARHAGIEETGVTLETALAALRALQCVPGPVAFGEREADALAREWSSSTEEVRLAVLDQLDVRRTPQFAAFLWGRVSPVRWRENGYRVRRKICERLSASGMVAWTRLAEPWKALVEAARACDLSAPGRHQKQDWESCGMPLAHLCWILPGLVLELEGEGRIEAVALLHDLRSIAAQGWEGDDPGARIDIGIEISLAEGFRVAAGRDTPADDRWDAEARAFFGSARSWVSRQALLQTLALRRRDAGDGLAVDGHPLVRETAAVLRLGAADGGSVWDDVRSLDDGGLNLARAAHRLLAVSTLLINLAEHAFGERGLDGVAPRDRAFTRTALPPCFTDDHHTATMLDCPCDCDFKLCGPPARDGVRGVDRRRFSGAFVKRAQSTCDAPLADGTSAITRRAFRDVWHALDDRPDDADGE